MTHYVVHSSGVALAFASDLTSANRIATLLQANIEVLHGPMPGDAERASADWTASRRVCSEDEEAALDAFMCADLPMPSVQELKALKEPTCVHNLSEPDDEPVTKVERLSGFIRKMGV